MFKHSIHLMFLFVIAFVESVLDDAILRRGLHLKAAAFHFPPYMIMSGGVKDENVTFSGFSVDVLTYLAHRFGIYIDYMSADQNDVNKHGVVQAAINLLTHKNEVDIVPMVLVQSTQRQRVMDFSIPVRIGASRLMLPYPTEESNASSIIESYSIGTWVLITATELVVILWIATATYCHSRWFPQKSSYPSFGSIFIGKLDYIIKITTAQGDYLPLTARVSVRIPAALWCLMTVVFVNAYTGSITSFIAIPRRAAIPHSLAEVAASSSNKYKMTAEANSVQLEAFLAATSGPFKVIGDSLRRYPHLMFRNYDEATAIVLKYKAAYMRGNLEIVNRIADDLRLNNGTCRLTASKMLDDTTFLSFGLPKNSAYNHPINHKLTPLWDSGLFDYWIKQYVPNVDKCLVVRRSSLLGRSRANSKAYNLIDLQGAFYFYLWGIALGILAFAAEFHYFRLQRTSRNKESRRPSSSK